MPQKHHPETSGHQITPKFQIFQSRIRLKDKNNLQYLYGKTISL
jgi:hypothetical protein